MKTFAALAIAAVALAPVARAQDSAKNSAPAVPKTEAALACLLDMSQQSCRGMFLGATVDDSPRAKVTSQDLPKLICFCDTLETVSYLGKNLFGDDVYVAKLARDYTYVLSQPTPDGRITALSIAIGEPAAWPLKKSRIALAAPVSAPRTIYSRLGTPATAELSAAAAPAPFATKPVVMLGTPDGLGDPNAIVCRAPQQIAGTGASGAEVCKHNYEWWRLAMNGKDLAADGKTVEPKQMVDDPKGDGDPEAVTCRTPKFVMTGPLVPVCRTNRFWAGIRKNDLFVDAHGWVTNRPVDLDGAGFN